MFEAVHISDIAALERMGDGLTRYQDDIEHALAEGRADLDHTMNYLGQRYSHWNHLYTVWSAEADKLFRRLQDCEQGCSNGRWDGRTIHAKCAGIYEELQAAAFKRDQALQCREIVSGLIRAVHDAGEAFGEQAGTIQRDLASAVPNAQKLLSRTAAKARHAAGLRFSGVPLPTSGTIFSANLGSAAGSSPTPGGGAQARPPAFGSVRDENMPPPRAGGHAPEALESGGIEGEPNPERGEGPARLPLAADDEIEVETTLGWGKEGRF